MKLRYKIITVIEVINYMRDNWDYLVYFLSLQKIFYRKNLRLQRVLNSDHWSRRHAR